MWGEGLMGGLGEDTVSGEDLEGIMDGLQVCRQGLGLTQQGYSGLGARAGGMI